MRERGGARKVVTNDSPLTSHGDREDQVQSSVTLAMLNCSTNSGTEIIGFSHSIYETQSD